MTANKIIHLSEYRGLVSISGDDRQKFLQGIISNDAKKISETELFFAFLLTPQGKYIADFLIFEHNQKYYLDCEKPRVPELIERLLKYKLRSKVAIEDASAEFVIFQNLDNELNEVSKNSETIILPDVRSPNLGSRIYTKSKITKNEGYASYTEARIKNLVAEGSTNFAGDFEIEGDYPLQFKMIETNGVDFKKGCYVGQEVTARTQHKGIIRKTIYAARADDFFDEKYGNIINKDVLLDGKKIGTLRSFANNYALIHAEIEAIEAAKATNAKVEISGIFFEV